MAIQLRVLTWDDPRGRGPTQALAQAFAKTKEGCDVELEWAVQPLGGFESDSVVQNAESFDVIVIDHPHVIEAASAGALAPIELDDESYLGPSLSSYQWRDQLWAVPIDASAHMAAYAENRYNSPPATWAGLFEQAEHDVRFAIPLQGVHALMALLTLLASMGTPFDATAAEQNPGAGLPRDEDLRRAAELLHRIASLCLAESLDWNPLKALSALAEGECDCLPLTFGYAHFQDRGVRFAPIPAVESAHPARPVLGGTGMAVSSRRPHLETAAALARFAGCAEVQSALWPEHGGQPAHFEAWRRLAKTDPFYHDVSSSVIAAHIRPRCLGWNRFQSTAGNAINEWLTGRVGSASELTARLRHLWEEATGGASTSCATKGGGA